MELVAWRAAAANPRIKANAVDTRVMPRHLQECGSLVQNQGSKTLLRSFCGVLSEALPTILHSSERAKIS